MSSDCAVNEQEELERMKRSFLRYAKSDDAMNAPERMQNPYLASLTTLRKAMGDLRQKRTNDMNIIMEALPHLHMDDGWKLAVRIDGDCYFQFSRFYAHNPIGKAKQIAGAIVGVEFEDDEPGEFDPILDPHTETNLFRHIRLDGSKEGYWEALLLRFASEQFFLGWHANYNVKRIITSVETFPSEIEGLKQVNSEKVYGLLDQWSGGSRLKWCNKMLSPDVLIQGDCAVVTFAYFSPFCGLRALRVVCKQSPFAIVELSHNGGFHYNCGITY